MIRPVVAVLATLLLAGCSSLDFYAPEVGPDWSSDKVTAENGALSADGVTVRHTGDEYSPVVSVGTLLAPSYSGARKETWSVSGPNGFQATIEVIQSDLVFSGPVDKNVLRSDLIQFEKARQVFLVKVGDQATLSVPGPIKTPSTVVLGNLKVVPTYQGIAAGKVQNYEQWGSAMGLRLTEGDRLVGYLTLTNGSALLKAPGIAAQPLLTALALVVAQDHFGGPTPPQKLVPEVIDVFGLKLTTEVSHN